MGGNGGRDCGYGGMNVIFKARIYRFKENE